MSDIKGALRVLAIVMHGIAAVTLMLLFLKTRGMTLMCVIPGALIGCAAAGAQPGRPITVYAAFGLLMGFAFWDGASMVSQRLFLDLIVTLVLAGGAVWFLRDPRWPAVLFVSIITLVSIGLAAMIYRGRFESDYGVEPVVRSFITTLTILTLSLLYVSLGFAEASLQKPGKRKRRKARPADED